MSKIYEEFYGENNEGDKVEDLVRETGSTLLFNDDHSQEETTTNTSLAEENTQESSQESSAVEETETTPQLTDELGIDISGSGQLSLFNWDDDPAPVNTSLDNKKDKQKKPPNKSVVETSGNAPVKKESKVADKPKIDKINIGAGTDWHIRYAGASYMVNLLFEEELILGITVVTLEELREKMITSEGCIELSPKRTHWNVDVAKQLLVLLCKGEDKGGLV